MAGGNPRRSSARWSAAIVFNDDYREAFDAILPLPVNFHQGLALTLYLTVGSFVVATGLGPVHRAGPRRVATPLIRNLAALYIEFIRGIPILVFIFLIALVLTPDFADLINLETSGDPERSPGGAPPSRSSMRPSSPRCSGPGSSQCPRPRPRPVGRSGSASVRSRRKIVLPQAVRNMLPALGNDLISLMKDTSLVSVLAVREITQMARLYSGSSFRFRESFFILVVLYVVLTLSLSLLLRWYERRIAIPA